MKMRRLSILAALLFLSVGTAKPIADSITPQDTPPEVTASVTATAVSSSEIRLDMSATTTVGFITKFDIFQNGVYIDTVYVDPPKPPTPQNFKVTQP